MPIPLPPPSSPPTQTRPAEPRLYKRQHKDWAIEQERYRHDQALYSVGEYCMVVLMWGVADFEAGLIGRCSTCQGPAGSLQSRQAAVYQQPQINRCPDCFGTTFEGGYRAKIVRPSIWTDAETSEKLDRRGAVHPSDASVESTWDFRMREGDYLFRADGSRWRIPSSPRRVQLRTGFAHPSQAEDQITYTAIQARMAEPDTVAYWIPPTTRNDLRVLLTRSGYWPQDFSDAEEIRGPLIPTQVMD